MPALLGLVGKEYEAFVLELFDTRKALEETRKELSHALYQNDAAVRVVARLAQERDEARQELANWKASGDNVPTQKRRWRRTSDQTSQDDVFFFLRNQKG